MADPNIATKAPESDIMEDTSLDTPITATTPSLPQAPPPPTNPTLSPHCTTDAPLPLNQTSTGIIVTYDTIETYISKPADYPSAPARLLLLLTNGRGVHSLNNQLQADSWATQGYVVVMPDLFSGDAAPNTVTTPDPSSATASWLDSIKARVVETSKSFMIDMWLARHGVEKVLPILDVVLEKAKSEFADAVANGGGIYAVGYCFGGKYVLVLAGERSDSVMMGQEQGKEEDVEAGMVKRGPEIKCGAVAHGTLVTREDLKGVKAPVSLVCVENDPLFPEEVLEFGKAELNASKVEHEVKVYSDVPHGFAVVGEYGSAAIKEAQMSASTQMIAWLQNH